MTINEQLIEQVMINNNNNLQKPYYQFIDKKLKFELYNFIEYFVEGYKSKLESEEEYKNCSDLMVKDNIINKQINNYHRIFAALQYLSVWDYLSHILKRILFSYVDTDHFNIDLFNKLYLDLESFFLNEDLEFVHISPLYNIWLEDIDNIELNEHLSIRKISEMEQIRLRNFSNQSEYNMYSFENIKYVIEYKFTLKKGFDKEEYELNHENLDSVFSSVIAALRLFENG